MQGVLPDCNVRTTFLSTVTASASIGASLEEAFFQASSLITHTQQVCQQCTHSCMPLQFWIHQPVALCRELLMVAVCLHCGFSAQDLSNKSSHVSAAASTEMALFDSCCPTLGTQTSSLATLGLWG